jgi:hypothetical protein
VGVRETRQIVGEYVLTKDDIIKGNKFKDVIAVGITLLIFMRPKAGSLNNIQFLL